MGRGLALLATACSASIAGSSVAAATVRQPTLGVVSTAPVTVRGTHFAARERVRVSFRIADASRVLTVRASPTGAFTAAAPTGLTYDRCSSPLFVSASGARGDRALLKLPQRLCPPG